ncbi:MAG: hypothetical protein ACYDDU_19490, partial [Dermatophilaceae bacterium]
HLARSAGCALGESYWGNVMVLAARPHHKDGREANKPIDGPLSAGAARQGSQRETTRRQEGRKAGNAVP